MKIVDLAGWNKFIDSMYASWNHRNPVTYKNVEYFIADSNTTCIINVKTGKVAVAKCHPKDKCRWSSKVGFAVAWAKYLGKEIPKCGVRYFADDIRCLKFGTKLYIRERTDDGVIDGEGIYAGCTGAEICIYNPDRNFTYTVDVDDLYLNYKDTARIMVYLPI